MTDAITATVMPAQAEIQPFNNAFVLNPLDSRLRGNDEVAGLAGRCVFLK
ncbi:MAG: hypothetical protein HY306_01770 [Nitrosomonadales bacterium]|nr:hypothetical protein [Nitrosomonadales bacterium]